MSITSQSFGAANALTSDFASDPYDGLMGMAFSSISTMGATTVFETLTKQAKLASNQFSFYLASAGSQLFLGGMDSAKYQSGTTKSYPVTNAGYWLLDAKVNVGGTAVSTVGKFSAIIDTGTSVIVVSAALFALCYSVRLIDPRRFTGSDGRRRRILGQGTQLGRLRVGLLHVRLCVASGRLVLVR